MTFETPDSHNLPGEAPPGLLPEGVPPQKLYRELKSVASIYLWREGPGHTLQPTALVHEALIRLAKEAARVSGKPLERWGNPSEFFRIAAVAMQRVLIEHARSKNAVRRGGRGRAGVTVHGGNGAVRIPLTDSIGAEAPPTPVQLTELQEALDKLETMDPRAAEVVRFRFFAGLTVEETARILGVSTTTAESDWRIARAWLARALGWTRT